MRKTDPNYDPTISSFEAQLRSMATLRDPPQSLDDKVLSLLRANQAEAKPTAIPIKQRSLAWSIFFGSGIGAAVAILTIFSLPTFLDSPTKTNNNPSGTALPVTNNPIHTLPVTNSPMLSIEQGSSSFNLDNGINRSSNKIVKKYIYIQPETGKVYQINPPKPQSPDINNLPLETY